MNAATAAAVISDERWLDCRVAIKAGKVLVINSNDYCLFVSGLGTRQRAKFVETAAGRIYLDRGDELHIFDDVRSAQHFVFDQQGAQTNGK